MEIGKHDAKFVVCCSCADSSEYYMVTSLNCIQNFHLGRYIVRYTVWNLVLRRHGSGAVKSDFWTYIQWFNFQNESFEYGYPHSNVQVTFFFQKTVKMLFGVPIDSRGCQLDKKPLKSEIM